VRDRHRQTRPGKSRPANEDDILRAL